MTLAEILRRTDFPRNTYDALLRREKLPFMLRTPRDGPDRYDEAHLIALQTYQQLRRIGMEARLAGETVNASFGAICRYVDDGKPANSTLKVGLRSYQDQNGHIFWEHIGSPNAQNSGLPMLGESSVPIGQVVNSLARAA